MMEAGIKLGNYWGAEEVSTKLNKYSKALNQQQSVLKKLVKDWERIIEQSNHKMFSELIKNRQLIVDQVNLELKNFSKTSSVIMNEIMNGITKPKSSLYNILSEFTVKAIDLPEDKLKSALETFKEEMKLHPATLKAGEKYQSGMNKISKSVEEKTKKLSELDKKINTISRKITGGYELLPVVRKT